MKKQILLHFSTLIVLLLLMPDTNLSAQKNVDSLLNVVSGSAGKARFDALKALGKIYKSLDPAKALKYAVEEREQALAMKDRVLEADALNDIAIPMLMMQQNRQAVMLLQESVRIYDSLNDKEGKAKVINNLGIAWSQIGSFENSLACYTQALNWYIKKKDLTKQARVYMSLGLVYEQLKKYDQALTAHHKALEIFTGENDERMMADAGVNLGAAYKWTGNFREAEIYFNRALDFYRQRQIIFGMAVATNNLAQLYKSKGDFKNAFSWYAKALPLIRQIRNTWAEAAVYLDLADIHYQQAHWNEALSNLTNAERLNTPENDPGLQSQIFHFYSRVYDTLQQYRLALDFFKRYTALKDTLASVEKTKVIEELSIRYETEKKGAENDLLKSDIQVHKLRQWMLTAFALAALLTAVFLAGIFIRKRKQLILNKIKSEQEAQEAKEDMVKMSQALTSKALHLAGDAEKKAAFAEKLAALVPLVNPEGQTVLQSLVDEFIKPIDDNLWEEFEKYFENIHPAFLAKLAVRFPDMTTNDRKICAMVRLDLSTKEIALMLNRSIRTIESAKYQIKKKLNVGDDQNLTSFLIAL
ncbi:MAG: tetratricopeptide repeat protein [Bacteroidetes bacterium]|nr:tetratricopeptide repeat protein [Bacteroidota bacterium]